MSAEVDNRERARAVRYKERKTWKKNMEIL